MPTANKCDVCGKDNNQGIETHAISMAWTHNYWWSCVECRPQVIFLMRQWSFKEKKKATKKDIEDFKELFGGKKHG